MASGYSLSVEGYEFIVEDGILYEFLSTAKVLLISRKMNEKGYIPVAFDGREYVVQGENVHIPPKIGRHRPDVLGINFETMVLCIGEAKTTSDLSSERTKEQFFDYARIIGMTSKQKFELIIGVPESAKSILLKLMTNLGLSRLPNISYIILPEELVDSD
jgi:hypothetical protein